MKRLTIVAATLAIVSGAAFRGSFGHWLAATTIGIYLGPPVVLFLGMWLVCGLSFGGKVSGRFKRTLLIVLILGGAVLLSLGTGVAIHHWEIQRARAYVAKIVPKLDQFYREHGHYPATLSAIDAADPPQLLADPYSYTGTSDSFRFYYWDTAGMMDGYYFDSTTRKWNYFD